MEIDVFIVMRMFDFKIEYKGIMVEIFEIVFLFVMSFDGYFFDSSLIFLVERFGCWYIVGLFVFYSLDIFDYNS